MKSDLQNELARLELKMEMIPKLTAIGLSSAFAPLDETIAQVLAVLQSRQSAVVKSPDQLVESTENTTLPRNNVGFHPTENYTASCKELKSKNSGKYLIKPPKYDAPFLGYCDQTVFEGGWLMIQPRRNGTVDFSRNWTEYRNGFESLDGDFWFGFEHIHRLTSERPHELLIVGKFIYGKIQYARYSDFKIGSEAEQYTLEKLESFTGTINALHKDALRMNFSTMDRDNDRSSGNCAFDDKSGWWFTCD